MVGFYSSYLEFIGAVYFSMSLDDILKKKIWSPQDARKQSKVLASLGEYQDKNFTKAVVDANQAKGLILQSELKKKSIVGLFLVAFLLLFCGYESYIAEINTDILYTRQLELAYTMTFFIITLFSLQTIIFRKWKYTICYILMIVITYFIINVLGLTYGKTIVEHYIVKHIGLFVCIIITIPILWQICITWLYKSVFYGYIKEKIFKAKSEYQNITNDIKNGKYDKLPKEYHEIYMKNSQKAPDTTAQQAMDDSLTEYQGVLYSKIRSIGNNIKLGDLLCSWIKYKIWSLCNLILGVFRFKGKNLVNPTKLHVNDFASYAQKYQTQKQKDRTLKMISFCNKEGINFEEFNQYYCRYCNNNK